MASMYSVKEIEYHVVTSENINKDLHLRDVKQATWLMAKEYVDKFYEVVDIHDYDKIEFDNGGRCLVCHANFDKVCGKQLLTCLNAGKQCYRRKYLID